MLAKCANGFGLVALAGLAADRARAAPKPPHRSAKARSVIFLYMDGGVSQVDSFDPKPRLQRDHGKRFVAKIEPTQFDDVGAVLASPWQFARHGECGLPVSSLFPQIGPCADRLCVIRSMVSDFSEHNTANYFLHTGSGQQGRPSAGAWLSYGLGSECRELPDFIVINGGLVPSGGPENFAAGFLPPVHQATVFRPQSIPLANIRRPDDCSDDCEFARRRLLRDLDDLGDVDLRHAAAVESAIANYELAYRMQTVVPQIADVSLEPRYVQTMYGLDHPNEPTRIFAHECLLARRLVERGVRFVELTCPRVGDGSRWDAHASLRANHSQNALAVDQPIAALISDLDARGLLDETLVVWAGEFGRTPFAQGSDGRDHNPYGFSIWMAGGGVRGGMIYGATDEHGYRVVENPVTIHDLHATMLHLMGIDHTQLTFRFGGRDMRLTDVYGNVIHAIIG
jgi:hypothetical protein